MKVVQVYAGEWVQPIRRGYKVVCCGCELVHIINFRLVKTKRGTFIQYQAFRNNKATYARRKRIAMALASLPSEAKEGKP